MGQIIIPQCKCISEQKEYNIGLGIGDFDKDYQNELGYCKTCRAFGIIGENNTCSCGDVLDRVYTVDMLDKGITTISCPRCGEEMIISVTGLWD